MGQTTLGRSRNGEFFVDIFDSIRYLRFEFLIIAILSNFLVDFKKLKIFYFLFIDHPNNLPRGNVVASKLCD